MVARIEVEGLRELRRDLNRLQKGASKAVGRAHKTFTSEIAADVNARASSQAVGLGGGAKVRGSAAQREAKLRAGGKHRARGGARLPWGRRAGNRGPDGRFRNAPRRPSILRAALRDRDRLTRRYLEEMAREISMELRR